jgi:hypothetical protein
MKVKIKLVYLKLDKGAFTKTFTEAMETQNRQAARAWLRAVLIKVPVWTGEAKGSLRPLGQFLKVAVPIGPISTTREAKRAISEGHTVAAGEGQGHFQFKNEDGKRFVFIFKTDVVHYLINEFYNVKPPINLIQPVPWFSLRAGKAAYKQYLNDNLKQKIPKIKSFLTSEIRYIE